MLLSIKATRRSQDMQDMPDSDEGRGSQIFEFEVPFNGPAPTVIVDCGSSHAFDMFQVRGEKLPRRPCPLRPRGEAPGPDGPPTSWLDANGRLKNNLYAPDHSKPGKVKPSDLFSVISISTCNGCPKAQGGVVGLKPEQDAILEAFGQQLAKEDFTGFETLGYEDRNVNRWKVMWDEVSIISD